MSEHKRMLKEERKKKHKQLLFCSFQYFFAIFFLFVRLPSYDAHEQIKSFINELLNKPFCHYQTEKFNQFILSPPLQLKTLTLPLTHSLTLSLSDRKIHKFYNNNFFSSSFFCLLLLSYFLCCRR